MLKVPPNNFKMVKYKFDNQAGAMDRAKKLVTIRDTEQESMFGYVFSVSGPGQLIVSALMAPVRLF